MGCATVAGASAACPTAACVGADAEPGSASRIGRPEDRADLFHYHIASETHYLWRPQLRDPGDEMVLEAAVNGQAQAIVTFNIRNYGDAATQFGVGLWLPRDALASMKG